MTDPIPLPAPATVDVVEKDPSITAEVVPDVAPMASPATVNESEKAMHENLTDPWIAIAGNSRRAMGFARQAPRRATEETVRNRMVVLGDELIDDGRCSNGVAQRLHVPRRTLSRWRCQRQHPHPILPRGRPCKESSPCKRRAVLEFLGEEGYQGLPTLRAEFPLMPRCELHDLQADYLQHFRATHRRSVARLTWHKTGTVWAIDHVVPPWPIEGVDRAILAIRDLASGMQLGWLPVSDQTGSVATAVLESLFLEHGTPLVLKSDNGSAFKSEAFQSLLVRYGVAWLPSPPRTPRYNGSCEAGNYSLEIRSDHFADVVGHWTADGLEAARRQANELTRPWGHLGPTHGERWSARDPIDPKQRKQLADEVKRHRLAILEERKDTFIPQNTNHQRQVQRQAVRRALLDLGLLTITWRSISLPINPRKWAKYL